MKKACKCTLFVRVKSADVLHRGGGEDTQMTSLQVKTVCSLQMYLFLVCAKYTIAWQIVFDERPIVLAPIAANTSSPTGTPLVCKVSPQGT